MAAESHDDLNTPDGSRSWASDYHNPVLWNSVLEGLITDPAGVYVDATLGGGGHTAALLDALGPSGRVVAIDRDEDALDAARTRLDADVESGRLLTVRGRFGDLDRHVRSAGIDAVDGVLLDIGVSSHQFDRPERGFSHRFEAPLDMRMDRRQEKTAADLVNGLPEKELADLIYAFGEEPASRRIARRIAEARPIETTTELAAAVRASVPTRIEAKVVSRVFQALRIAVNDEMDELEKALIASTRVVRTGGRLAVISYHSLEDRRVKRFMRSGNFEGTVRKDLYGNPLTPWTPVGRSSITPDDAEIEQNPRARSARLRIAERAESETEESQGYGNPQHH
ncbi:MAG: 16S rRNA (cytosine(1402)-N(4))-methyltransferase RsmH [Rhodothermales bacterium]|nr:16S rRNA (cytosine(1402)-N(4))-methyltransferase RsmH [Rhodothermales bacterium]